MDSPANGVTLCTGSLAPQVGGELGRPGYGLYDRSLGAMYLQG